jgi:hypothetical protein
MGPQKYLGPLEGPSIAGRFLAIGLPLLVFAGAHRQGIGGVRTALFLKRRDLLAVMTAHFIVGVIPNVLVPLFSDDYADL